MTSVCTIGAAAAVTAVLGVLWYKTITVSPWHINKMQPRKRMPDDLQAAYTYGYLVFWIILNIPIFTKGVPCP
jgi:hypothetical protein